MRGDPKKSGSHGRASGNGLALGLSCLLSSAHLSSRARPLVAAPALGCRSLVSRRCAARRVPGKAAALASFGAGARLRSVERTVELETKFTEGQRRRAAGQRLRLGPAGLKPPHPTPPARESPTALLLGGGRARTRKQAPLRALKTRHLNTRALPRTGKSAGVTGTPRRRCAPTLLPSAHGAPCPRWTDACLPPSETRLFWVCGLPPTLCLAGQSHANRNK